MLKYVAPIERRLRHISLPPLPARTHPTAVTRHDVAPEETTTPQRIAEHTAAAIGSWRFIGAQAGVMAVWVLINSLALFHVIRFDSYPFVFLNLAMSAEAAFTGPILLIAANVGAIRDHRQYDRIEQMEQRVLAALEQREQRRKDEEGGAA